MNEETDKNNMNASGNSAGDDLFSVVNEPAEETANPESAPAPVPLDPVAPPVQELEPLSPVRTQEPLKIVPLTEVPETAPQTLAEAPKPIKLQPAQAPVKLHNTTPKKIVYSGAIPQPQSAVVPAPAEQTVISAPAEAAVSPEAPEPIKLQTKQIHYEEESEPQLEQVVPQPTIILHETGAKAAPENEGQSSRFRNKSQNHKSPMVIHRDLFSESSSLGKILLEARTSAGYTLPQVEQFTRIRTDYLDALEHDDMKRLPPLVFISAYIRSLISLYNLDTQAAELVQSRFKALSEKPTDVPEKLLHDLESDHLVNEEEEKKIQKIFYGVAAGIVLVILLATYLIIAAVVSSQKSKAPAVAGTDLKAPVLAPDAQFDSQSLETLKAPQVPVMRVLRVPK